MSQRPLRRGNWSVQELERLRGLLPRRGVEATAGLLRRSPESVLKKALSLLRVPPRRGDWTEGDDRLLRLSWGAVDARLLGPMLGRPTAEVRRRAAQLRAQPRVGAWSPAEQKLLKQLYGTRDDRDLEVCLQRPEREIAAVAQRLCLAKDKRYLARWSGPSPRPASEARERRARMPRWTAAEIQRLRAVYPDHDNLTVARQLGRSVTSVANKANQLGLKKSSAVLAAIGRTNISIRYGTRRDAVADGG